MSRYLLRRLLSGVVAFFIFTAIVFFAFNLLTPFDFVTTLSLSLPGEEAREALRQELGLHLPLWQQYFFWLGRLFQGNLGSEFTLFGRGRPVTEMLNEAIPSTLLVFMTSAFMAFWLGQWLGKMTAWRKSSLFSGSITVGSIALYTAFPPWLAFLLGFILIGRLGVLSPGSNLFARSLWLDAPFSISTAMYLMLGTFVAMLLIVVILSWLSRRLLRRSLPTLAAVVLFIGGTVLIWFIADFLAYAQDISKVALIPFLTFLMLAFGDTMLLMQSGMRDVKHETYIQTARAKGMSQKEVRDKHAARNALLPVLSRFVVNLPYLLTAAVIIEQATGWHGMGQLMFDTVYNQNTYVYMGMLVAVGFVALVARLTLDVLYAYLDPRIRYSQGANGRAT